MFEEPEVSYPYEEHPEGVLSPEEKLFRVLKYTELISLGLFDEVPELQEVMKERDELIAAGVSDAEIKKLSDINRRIISIADGIKIEARDLEKSLGLEKYLKTLEMATIAALEAFESRVKESSKTIIRQPGRILSE